MRPKVSLKLLLPKAYRVWVLGASSVCEVSRLIFSWFAAEGVRFDIFLMWVWTEALHSLMGLGA